MNLEVSDANGISELFASIFSGTTSVIALIFYVIVVIGLWKVFTKAGYAGILGLGFGFGLGLGFGDAEYGKA